jgi:hypothetical protein
MEILILGHKDEVLISRLFPNRAVGRSEEA